MGGGGEKVAEKKCLCNAGVPKSEKNLAWVPLIFDLFKSKKNETNKNKKIYFNTINNNELSMDSGLYLGIYIYKSWNDKSHIYQPIVLAS